MEILVAFSMLLMISTISKALNPEFFWFSPLGGSAIAEMGIVLGIAVCVSMLLQLV